MGITREQADLAERLRDQGATWVEIAESLRERWPELTARAAMRVAHRWSQADVARRWNNRWSGEPKTYKNISYWERWPHSGRAPKLDDLARLAAIYQCAVGDLLTDLADHRHRDENTPRMSVGLHGVDGEDVQRREFLGGAVALTATGAGVGDHADAVLGLVGASRFDRARLAIQRGMRLERASQYTVLGALVPRLIADIEQLTQAHRNRADAAGLLSHAHALQAWLLIKQDAPASAEAAARRALDAAEQTNDAVLIGAALRCLSEAHMRAGAHGLACDLAIEAAELVRRATPTDRDALAVQGAGYLSAATACARDGNATAAQDLLDTADTCAHQLGHDVAAPAVFGPSNVAIHRVAIAIDLGDPVTALRHAEHTRPQPPPGCKERHARYFIDVARAYTQRRQDDHAVEVLLHAEQAASEEVRTHRLTRAVVAELLGRERRGHTPELRPLAQRCAVLEPA